MFKKPEPPRLEGGGKAPQPAAFASARTIQRADQRAKKALARAREQEDGEISDGGSSSVSKLARRANNFLSVTSGAGAAASGSGTQSLQWPPTMY